MALNRCRVTGSLCPFTAVVKQRRVAEWLLSAAGGLNYTTRPDKQLDEWKQVGFPAINPTLLSSIYKERFDLKIVVEISQGNQKTKISNLN